MTITPEFAAKCEAAMTKPAPLAALQLIASGRVVIVVKGTDIYLDTLDRKTVRHDADTDKISKIGRMMGLAGAWPLVAAGMVDQFGVVTDKGRAFLAHHANGGDVYE